MDIRREDAAAAWLTLAAAAAGAVWRWRLELALLVAVGLSWRVLDGPLGELAASLAIASVIAAVLATPSLRRVLMRSLRSARVRRRWRRAWIDVGLPRVVARRVRWLPAGPLVRIRCARGSSIATVAAHAEPLAACLGVCELRIGRDAGHAAWGTALLVERDPLEGMSRPWPFAEVGGALSLWAPIPVGVDELGNTVAVSLPERNLLIGGEPGAGKSAAMSLVLAAAAMDPTARLWLLDGKLVELAAWEPSAERIAGADVEHAIALLEHVQGEMEARYRELLARGQRKISREDGLPLHVIACDELAFYLTAEDRKQRTRFAELLRDLVARGRAAGVIVIAATQKPAADVVPTALRDLFGFRLAMRCTTPQASDTILGQGWSSQGHNAATIGPAQRGVGLLLAEDGLPVRLRSFYLDDQALDQLAERACALRADAWLAAEIEDTELTT
jgi:hypothetical protein